MRRWVNCRAPGGGGGLEVEVVDGGEGIAPDDVSRIFDEFAQLARDENGDSSGVDGTGLGLPVARRLALLLRGSIDVSSTAGVGSTFRLALPPAPPATAVQGAPDSRRGGE